MRPDAGAREDSREIVSEMRKTRSRGPQERGSGGVVRTVAVVTVVAAEQQQLLTVVHGKRASIGLTDNTPAILVLT